MQRHRKKQAADRCPICMADSKHVPLSQVCIHKLPCPVHGAFELLPENQLAWSLWQQYDLCNVLLLPKGKPLLRLDYPAIRAVCDLYDVPQAEQRDTLEKLQMIFNLMNEKRND